MGNKLCNGTCMSEEMTLSTPFGQCSCGRSVCSCLSAPNVVEAVEDEITKQINDAMKTELAAVEQKMKEALIHSIGRFGALPLIHVLGEGAVSPVLSARTMTVRIKQREPVDEVKEQKESSEYSMKFIKEDEDVVKDHSDVMD